MKNGTTTHKNSNILIKLNWNVPHDPAILILGIYLIEIKISVYTNTSTEIFIAALFIITKD